MIRINSPKIITSEYNLHHNQVTAMTGEMEIAIALFWLLTKMGNYCYISKDDFFLYKSFFVNHILSYSLVGIWAIRV